MAHEPRLPFPGRALGTALSAVVCVAAVAACSSGSGTAATAPPSWTLADLQSSESLVSTCDAICNNVVAQCGVAASAYGACLSACQDLSLVQLGCVDALAAYLACLGGATSVQCEGDGRTVVLRSPSCAPQQQAFEGCTANLSVAGCVELSPAGTTCPAGGAGALFCVGHPAGCQAAATNAFGIGSYCCP